MAGYINGLLQNYIAVNSAVERNLIRECPAGAWDYIVDQTLSPDGRVRTDNVVNQTMWDNARANPNQVQQILVHDYRNNPVVVATNYQCDIECSYNDDALVTVQFYTLSTGFCISEDLLYLGRFNYEDELNMAIRRHLLAMRQEADKIVVARLETEKNQVWTNSFGQPTTGAVLTYTWAQRLALMNLNNAIMQANCYTAPNANGMLNSRTNMNNGRAYSYVVNSGVPLALDDVNSFGPNNAMNLSRYIRNSPFWETNNILNDTDMLGTGYMIQDGNIGLLVKHDVSNIMNRIVPNHEFGIMTFPEIGVPVDYHHITEAPANLGSSYTGTTLTGVNCAIQEKYIFNLQFGIVTSVNLDRANQASPFLKFQIGEPAEGNVIGALPVDVVRMPTAAP